MLAAAAVLVPSMKCCRKFAGGAGVRRKQLAESSGRDVGQLKTEQARRLFSGYQASGCRTWFEDGNA